MSKTRAILAALAIIFLTLPAMAEQMLADQAQEARAQAIFHQLRCMVCQGQSIADSNAPLATDMRRLVRKKIQEGLSEGQIIAALTTSYGEFILMKPPLQRSTLLLWGLPFVILFMGLWVIIRSVSAKNSSL